MPARRGGSGVLGVRVGPRVSLGAEGGRGRRAREAGRRAMNPQESSGKRRGGAKGVSRRRFLVGALGATAVGAGHSAAAQRSQANPYAYSVTAFEEVDPKWLQYREIASWNVPYAPPRRLSVGRDGTIWVGAATRLLSFDERGRKIVDVDCGEDVVGAAELGDGRLAVALRRAIELRERSGERIARWDPTDKRAWFSGVAARGERVFAADSKARIVRVFDLSGKEVGRFGGKDPARGAPGLVLPSPTLDVCWHPAGFVVVNNAGRRKVEFYTEEGRLELSWGQAGVGIERFCGCCNPVAVAAGPKGEVFTAEKGLPRVKEYDAHGELQAVVLGPKAFPKVKSSAGAPLWGDLVVRLDAATDAAGRVWVLDTAVGRVRALERKKQ